jgi:protein TonB
MLFIVPAPEKKKAGGEFLTDLVSPEEILHPKASLSPPRARSAPSSRPRSAARAPEIRKRREMSVAKETSPAPQNRSAGVIKDARTVPPSAGNGGQGEFTGKKSPTGATSEGTVQPPERPVPTLSEKLFDRAIIGSLAKRNMEKEDKKDKTFTFDAKEYRFLIYNRRLKERIESIWHYPPDAAAQGIYGDLIIRFTIKKDGHLGAVELVRTSGHKNLDDAAIEALRDGEPYWPLPTEWGMEGYTIEGHFVYSLYGYYIR